MVTQKRSVYLVYLLYFQKVPETQKYQLPLGENTEQALYHSRVFNCLHADGDIGSAFFY